jgi:hypothetical protein
MNFDLKQQPNLTKKLTIYGLMGLSTLLFQACTPKHTRASPPPSRDMPPTYNQSEFTEVLKKVRKSALEHNLNLELIELSGFYIVDINPSKTDSGVGTTLRVQILPTFYQGVLSVAVIFPDKKIKFYTAKQTAVEGKPSGRFVIEDENPVFTELRHTPGETHIIRNNLAVPLKTSSPAAAAFKDLSNNNDYQEAMRKDKVINPW